MNPDLAALIAAASANPEAVPLAEWLTRAYALGQQHAPILTSAEVAQQLGIRSNTVNLHARTYDIGVRVGRDRLYTLADLERLRTRRPAHRPPSH